jgi:hypothetical protein
MSSPNHAPRESASSTARHHSDEAERIEVLRAGSRSADVAAPMRAHNWLRRRAHAPTRITPAGACAIYTRQRRSDAGSVLLATLTAPVGEVIQWAAVERLTVTGEGHQRLRNEAKIRAIGRFLNLDPRNTIPTAVTVALSDLTLSHDPQLDSCSTVEVPSSDPPAGLVIDGQHRLFGMSAFDPSLRVNVVALINPSDEEVASSSSSSTTRRERQLLIT